jgi:hypothetical protein
VAGERHGNRMVCVNQTRPHCVNQMGKTLSKQHKHQATIDDDDLLKCCMDLVLVLRSESSRDLDGTDLCAELKIFREIVPESVRTAIQWLQYLRTVRDSFPNTAIAYRISLLKILKLTFMIVWNTVIYSLVSSSLLHV